jgi:hypothetical protein
MPDGFIYRLAIFSFTKYTRLRGWAPYFSSTSTHQGGVSIVFLTGARTNIRETTLSRLQASTPRTTPSGQNFTWTPRRMPLCLVEIGKANNHDGLGANRAATLHGLIAEPTTAGYTLDGKGRSIRGSTYKEYMSTGMVPFPHGKNTFGGSIVNVAGQTGTSIVVRTHQSVLLTGGNDKILQWGGRSAWRRHSLDLAYALVNRTAPWEIKCSGPRERSLK